MSIKRKLEYLAKTKQEIRKAIISRGVDVDRDDTFRSYAGKIRDIEIYDEYTGPYAVGPSLEPLVLPTSDKVMTGDVTVDVYPEFEGSYIITPSTTEQTIQTKDKVMTDNLTVDAMTVYDGSYMPYLTSIAVTKQPNRLEYGNGDAISLAGLEVTAYYDNGKPYGQIPVQDITVDKHYASRTTDYAITKVYLANQSLLTMSSQYWGTKRNWRKENAGEAYFAVIRYMRGAAPFTYENCPLLIADNENAAWMQFNDPPSTSWDRAGSHISTRNGYYYPPSALITGNISYIDTQVYGEFDTFGEGFDAVIADIEAGRYDPGKQTITVSWPRVGDGAILNTSFDIYITKKAVLNNE